MVANISPVSSSPVQFEQAEISKTTWKTHALVVTGYLLMSIGMAFSATSLYVSIIVHPVVALTIPTIAIALGSICLHHKRQMPVGLPQAPPQAFEPSLPPFKGIKRWENQCWIIASMQMLLHIPSFANLIKNANREKLPQLTTLFDAFDAYQSGRPIESRELEKWLQEQKVTITSDASTQDDPIRFLDFVFKAIGYQLPTLFEKSSRYNDRENEWSIVARQSHSKDPYRYISLTDGIDPENPTLEKAIEKYFTNVLISRAGNVDISIKFFKDPPDDFLVEIAREGYDFQSTDQAADDVQSIEPVAYDPRRSSKQLQKCLVPLHLTMPAKYVSKPSTYACDGFSFHSGGGVSSGHWTSVIKKDGKWWHANDLSVNEMSESKALKMAKQASHIHYTKV